MVLKRDFAKKRVASVCSWLLSRFSFVLSDRNLVLDTISIEQN
jgi:hypothetical protein